EWSAEAESRSSRTDSPRPGRSSGPPSRWIGCRDLVPRTANRNRHRRGDRLDSSPFRFLRVKSRVSRSHTGEDQLVITDHPRRRPCQVRSAATRCQSRRWLDARSRRSTRSKVVIDLRVALGRLALSNPVLVASGTFGYVREMAPFVRLERLG